MKDFADDNFKFDENSRKLFKPVENTVGKEEIAHYEQYLFFPQCFQKAYFPGASKGVIVWEWVNLLPTDKLDSSKLKKLVQTIIVLLMKMVETPLKEYKTLLEKNCLLQAISPFSTEFFLKEIYCKDLITWACLGKS